MVTELYPFSNQSALLVNNSIYPFLNRAKEIITSISDVVKRKMQAFGKER